MNDNDIRFGGNERNTYRATSNLNTAIENPQINMNSAVDVNIKDIDSVNSDLNSNNIFNSSNGNSENQNFVGSNNSVGNSQMNSNNSFVFSDNNLDKSNSFSSDTYSQNISNSSVTSNYVATSGNDQVVYEPTMKAKKKHGVTIKVNRELKVMIFIVLILLIFIFIVPYIYDFFKELQLVITTG